MQIQILSVAQKMPGWVEQGTGEYLKRLPREMTVKIITLALVSRKSKNSADKLKLQESKLLMGKMSATSLNIALDEKGDQWSSNDWSKNMSQWMQSSPKVNIVIGGPDGLSDECRQVCRHKISLGRMTMPHALVRIVLAEQLYRAWSILHNHPYHRQ